MQELKKDSTNTEPRARNVNEDAEIPSWLSDIVARFKQAHLSFTVDDIGQLQLSPSLKDFVREIMLFAQQENHQPPPFHLLQELKKLGAKEIEEISTTIGIDLSSQKQKASIQYIQHQFVFPPPVVTAPKKTFGHTFGLPEEFINFTGRKEPLEQLQQHLLQTQTRAQPRVIISGTGGIGKTQLAVATAYQQMKYYQESTGKIGCQSVIWFIAGTDEGVDNKGLMTEQFHRLGLQLGLDPKQLDFKDLVEMVYQQIHEKHGPFMVVFDNAQNIRQISTYLPLVKVPIIITTRNNNNRDFDPSFKTIALAIFTEEEALNYIQKIVNHNSSELYQENEAKLLAKSLGYFPLALTQALAYITAENISLQRYLEEFTQQKAQYLQERLPMGDPYQEEKNPSKEVYDPQKATIWTVIQLSLKKVMQADANQILKACSYLAPEAPIDCDLLAYWTATPKECREAIAALRVYSLLESTIIPNHVRIHQIVQEVLRLSDHEEVQITFLACVAEFIGQRFVKEEKPLADEERRKISFPHLQTLLGQIEKLSENDKTLDQIKGPLNYYLGILHYIQRNLVEADRCFRKALKVYELYFNEKAVANTLSNLAGVCLALGDATQAKVHLTRALDIHGRTHGLNELEVGRQLTNLGYITLKSGDAHGAKYLLKKGLFFLERIFGSDSHEVAPTLLNLGLTLQELGSESKAKTLYERALAINERTFGPAHPNLAIVLTNLGSISLNQEDAVSAKDYFERALAINEKEFGLHHPKVASDLTNLGVVLRKLGEDAKAKALYERALLIEERILGLKHLEVAQVRYRLALCLVSLRLFHDALTQLQLCYSVFITHFGAQHPKCLDVQKLIKALYSDQSTPAKNTLGKALTQLIEDPALLKFDNLLQVARGCYEAGLILQTQKLIDLILDLETSVQGLLYRAYCQIWLRQFKDCRETVLLCQAVAEREEDLSEITFFSQKIEQEQNTVEQLEDRLGILLSLEDPSPSDKISTVVTLNHLRRPQESLEILNKLIASQPTAEFLATAYYQQAQCYFALQEYALGLESCELSTTINNVPAVIALKQRIILASEIAPLLEQLISQLQHQLRATPTL